MSWKTFLESAAPAEHAVQVYTDLDELAVSVGRFLDAGFRVGDPAVVIADPSHWDAFRAELESRGHGPAELQAKGLLTHCDAEETLARFMDGDVPSPERFEQTVGAVVDDAVRRFPDKTVRAFGEMVDLLFKRGQEASAIALEELWNRLLATRRCALLCGYELDVFDFETQTSALPEIVRAHTHPRPIADPPRLAAAVHEALTEVVGSDAAASVYLKVAEAVPRTALPRGQAVLMWLTRHQPRTAERVLQGARVRYARAG